MIKKVNATADWQNIDYKRGDGNGIEAHRLLWASEEAAESADYPQDLYIYDKKTKMRCLKHPRLKNPRNNFAEF